MKRIGKLLILPILFVVPLIPVLGTVADEDTEQISCFEDDVIIEEVEVVVDPYELLIEEMQAEMNAIKSIEDPKEYFLEYKRIIQKYDELDPPETIYDYYSNEELDLLFRVVEAEATEGGFNEKANVASVIFNRIYHDEFGNTMNDVLVENQFSCISDGRYLEVKITEDTILACEYVFMIEDTTDGAIFFEKGTGAHASYANYTFTDNIGHNFYNEKGSE